MERPQLTIVEMEFKALALRQLILNEKKRITKEYKKLQKELDEKLESNNLILKAINELK